MKQWRVVDYEFRFTHKVEDRPELVDSACLKHHIHGTTRDPAVITVSVYSKEWIDFKEIKRVLENVLISLSKEISDEIDQSKKLPYYDFGLTDIEGLSKNIYERLLASLSVEEIKLVLRETKKYSMMVEIDSSLCSIESVLVSKDNGKKNKRSLLGLLSFWKNKT